MSHPDAETLIQSYGVNLQVVRLQTDGLTHADSLLQPPFRGNCLNWVLGHILVGRNTALELLARPRLWDEALEALYRTGSEPLADGRLAVPLDQLLADLERSQQDITDALEDADPEDLARDVPFRGGERALGQALGGLHWHETYHLGQLELLRQLAGTDDAII